MDYYKILEIDVGLAAVESVIAETDILLDNLEMIALNALVRTSWLNRHWQDLEGLEA